MASLLCCFFGRVNYTFRLSLLVKRDGNLLLRMRYLYHTLTQISPKRDRDTKRKPRVAWLGWEGPRPTFCGKVWENWTGSSGPGFCRQLSSLSDGRFFFDQFLFQWQICFSVIKHNKLVQLLPGRPSTSRGLQSVGYTQRLTSMCFSHHLQCMWRGWAISLTGQGSTPPLDSTTFQDALLLFPLNHMGSGRLFYPGGNLALIACVSIPHTHSLSTSNTPISKLSPKNEKVITQKYVHMSIFSWPS